MEGGHNTHCLTLGQLSSSQALRQRHHFYRHFVSSFLSRDWIDFALSAVDCFDFLGLFSPICCSSCWSLNEALLVTRSVDFYLLVFVDLTGSDWRDQRRIVLIHSSTEQRCWSCFSSRSIFPHSDTQTHTHTVVLFHQRALSPAQFFPQSFLTLRRARQEPLLLCVDPSCWFC